MDDRLHSAAAADQRISYPLFGAALELFTRRQPDPAGIAAQMRAAGLEAELEAGAAEIRRADPGDEISFEDRFAFAVGVKA